MLIIAIITGLILGWIINRMSDYLPRFAANKNKRSALEPIPYPATVALVMRVMMHKAHQAQRWFWLHLVVEWSTIFMLCFLCLWLGLTGESLILCGVFAFLMLIAIIDIKYRLILNVMVYPATVAVLFVPLTHAHPSALQMGLGGVLVFCIFGLTAWLKPGQLGGGDIKLAIFIGFLFGFPQVLWALLIGSGTGAGMAIAMLLTGRYSRKSTIPYAPFLCLGAMIALIYNPILG